jgi:DNA-binding response OmpR family regulator
VTARVLVVEDEPAIRDAVTVALEQERYQVEAVATAAEALARTRASAPDVLVLDVMLPDGSGIDVCRRLRAESDVPIIMLTARSTEVDRVLGLEVGADDYVVKPFSLAELVSRVRALLRRRELDRVGAKTTVAAGDLRIDLVRQEATVDGRSVALTPAELRLLTRLAGEPGRAFSRDELMEALWDVETSGASRACDTHVLNLRRKLDGAAIAIETVRGFGYRLRALERLSGNPD